MKAIESELFRSINYKSIEEAKDGLANVYKSITGNDLKQQIFITLITKKEFEYI